MKIGITGTIASGKTQVENFLKEKYCVIDLDEISHDILETTAKEEVLREFNTIDRKILADIVFNDDNKRKKIESIIHPKLKEYINSLDNNKIIFISGALIYDAGFDNLFDKIIYINATKDVRLERLKKRNNLDENNALKRINSQNEEGKLKADVVLENNSTLEKLKEELKEALKKLNLQF